MVFVLGGKRKSGKDFVADLIEEHFPSQVMRFRIAEPIKSAFAEENNLDLNVLLSPGPLKEEWRERMVIWSENMRSSDPHYFTRKSLLLKNNSSYPIWMLTDARRECDMEYFVDSKEFSQDALIIRLKIVASTETRTNRGYVFTPGIDDATTECGLDKFTGWDHVIMNDNSKEELLSQLKPIFETVQQACII